MSTPDELDTWLARDYATAYRTACLVLRDPHKAQDAVQKAFLRVWRSCPAPAPSATSSLCSSASTT